MRRRASEALTRGGLLPPLTRDSSSESSLPTRTLISFLTCAMSRCSGTPSCLPSRSTRRRTAWHSSSPTLPHATSHGRLSGDSRSTRAASTSFVPSPVTVRCSTSTLSCSFMTTAFNRPPRLADPSRLPAASTMCTWTASSTRVSQSSASPMRARTREACRPISTASLLGPLSFLAHRSGSSARTVAANCCRCPARQLDWSWWGKL
mmetsp:Transcript_49336/g.154754  ORF Transcript_49336/g.154754 Transcript_49336/m.154754 type:complete len:206 (+) Transcript_49336:491-1108(+)